MSTTDTAVLRQGSQAWIEARLGKITASRFNDILTQPKTKAAREAGEMSQTAHSYMLELIAEILTGLDQGPRPNWAMQWGTDNEPAAREVYENRTGDQVDECGFIIHPEEPMVGCSPDGLVGDEGGLEIKCPFNTRIHLGYVLADTLPADYIAQVHGALWITGRRWWDFVSYDPRIPDLNLALWRTRVYRPDTIIVKGQKLDVAVLRFRDTLLETLCTLKGNMT